MQLLKQTLENISKEQNSVSLLGDFNVNLLNYNEHNQKNKFLDSLAFNSFTPLILQPTRIICHSNTLIDNIFSNFIYPGILSGNSTATISDHLSQFSIIVKTNYYQSFMIFMLILIKIQLLKWELTS